MKKLAQVFGVIFYVILFSSCEIHDYGTPDLLTRKALSAKWAVAGESDYQSFEFNLSGSYLVVKKEAIAHDPIIRFGTYRILDYETVELSGFGTLKVSTFNSGSFDFSLRLAADPDTDIRVNTLRQKEMERSAKTDLICRTWKIQTVDGYPAAQAKKDLTVLFSAAGTYFVTYAVKISESDGRSAQWKWKDNAEAKLLYSWDPNAEWDDAHSIEIPKLTSDSLVIIDNQNTVVLEPVLAVDLPLK